LTRRWSTPMMRSLTSPERQTGVKFSAICFPEIWARQDQRSYV
jgi:hypothetical protein